MRQVNPPMVGTSPVRKYSSPSTRLATSPTLNIGRVAVFLSARIRQYVPKGNSNGGLLTLLNNPSYQMGRLYIYTVPLGDYLLSTFMTSVKPSVGQLLSPTKNEQYNSLFNADHSYATSAWADDEPHGKPDGFRFTCTHRQRDGSGPTQEQSQGKNKTQPHHKTWRRNYRMRGRNLIHRVSIRTYRILTSLFLSHIGHSNQNPVWYC